MGTSYIFNDWFSLNLYDLDDCGSYRIRLEVPYIMGQERTDISVLVRNYNLDDNISMAETLINRFFEKSYDVILSNGKKFTFKGDVSYNQLKVIAAKLLGTVNPYNLNELSNSDYYVFEFKQKYCAFKRIDSTEDHVTIWEHFGTKRMWEDETF